MPPSHRNTDLCTDLEDHRRVSILVVDDDLINRQILKTVLQRAGYEVDVAENGQVAISRFRSKDYHLIIMDMHMPMMDGISAARAIRRYEWTHSGAAVTDVSVPIIGVTADVQDVLKAQAAEAGMTCLLIKPISRTLLLDTVKDCLALGMGFKSVQ